MSSTFHLLETSKRSLLTHQVALQTTGQNITNASTTGYSRQRVSMVASRPLEAPGLMRSNTPGQIGTGVEYDSITRIRNTFLDVQYRRENQSMGSWQIQNETLTAIQNIVNEPSTNGLSTVMDKFWNSWETLNRDPSLLSARVAVAGAASNMADTFKHIGESLTSLEKDINSSIDKKVQQANTLIDGIADLNHLIRYTEALGNNANDYRDQRDVMIDQLSSIVDVSFSEDSSGMTNITSAGVNVVSGETGTHLTTDAATDATSGELNGYVKSLGETGKIRDQLNALVNTLATGDINVTLSNGYVTKQDLTALNDVTLKDGTVIPKGTTIPAGSSVTSSIQLTVKGFNGLHELGYTLTSPTTDGVPFFTANGGGDFTIDNIAVNPAILKDTNMIAASSKYETLNGVDKAIRGNSDIANAIAGLRDAIFTFPDALTSLSNGTTDDYFRAVVGDLGIRSNNVETNYNNQQTMVDNIEIQRQSTSGVSLDEEFTDMIRFQKAYNAAARVVTAVDEMLDKIINSMGIVGR
ncbi:flagellar hook-associated protein FlgK [Gorillibacterium massiliense]|uniref:flagellar hook-associated protein FlgK n=1 Tax=Gorillibacterium massiliense TaxID=1280390 RepID=UPI0004B3409A|nr:flagellar hook-associated protein FlgK [Gorillibacterium massiliense]